MTHQILIAKVGSLGGPMIALMTGKEIEANTSAMIRISAVLTQDKMSR